MIFEVHQSGIKCYRECRQKHHYRYIERIERRRRPNPLVRGTIIHSMIENRNNGLDPFAALKDAEKKYAKLFREEREEYGDLPGDIRRLMTGYFDWYKRDPVKPVKVKGRLAEHPFEVDLAPGIVLAGKIDQFATTRDGRLWVEDHKSHRVLPRGDINYTDIQGVLYCWVSPQAFKLKPDGVLWNYIRFKAPAVPEQLKNGELTRRDIDTLWPAYLAEIKRLKLDPKDYEDMRKKLAGKESTFFHRAYVPAHPKLMANVLDEARETAIEMKAEKRPIRNIGRHCEWCEFYNLCSAELRGLDAATIRKKDYQPKEEQDDVEVEAA